MPGSRGPHRLRAIGYVRVSTDQQAQEGVSLQAQETRIRAHCISQELELIDLIIDDGYSAKSLERPGIQRALRLLTAGKADAIVVVKLDRLTRSVRTWAPCSMAISARDSPIRCCRSATRSTPARRAASCC